MPGYRTGVIDRVPREKAGRIVDGIIVDDDGTLVKFRWPAEWKKGNTGMKGMRVRYYKSGDRAMGIKKGLMSHSLTR